MNKILVVDDDQKLCRIIASTLKKAGYNVKMAFSAVDGLKIALEEHPDIILSDYAMPDQDGRHFCTSVRDHDEIAKTYFIMITGHGNNVLKTEGLSKLFDDYLEKPVDLVYLKNKINAVVRRLSHMKINH